MRFALFALYSYVEHVFWGLCGVLPPFLRSPLFHLVLKRLGHGTLIDYGTYIRYPWKGAIAEFW